MSVSKVIVIGGGPAGMIAASEAAKSGTLTILLEKQNQLGHKLSLTGKGRCNLTNTAELEQFLERFGRNGRFLRQAFNEFFSEELTSMFRDLGVEIKTERGGRIFPDNDDAVAITEAMVRLIKKNNVKFRMNSHVTELMIENDKIFGVRCGGKIIKGDAVIIATGGLSYPATGSTGDGYRLAKSAGHNIINTRPALIPLVTKGNIAKRLQGVSLRNVKVKLIIDGKKKADAFGEMLFTHYGLSGPIILTLSRLAVDALNEKKKVKLSIDLKPALDMQKLEERLLRDIKELGKRQISALMKGLLPSKMIPVSLDLNKLDHETTCNHIKTAERRRLCEWLKNFEFEVISHRPIKEAIVTAGGIATKEINPRTMESKLVKGLYFAGETIDVDGETGGYNLQAAFSTGWLAGKSAGEQ